jgi:hypothetical protein
VELPFGKSWIWDWKHQRWWYRLAHVSRLWRRIILASPSKLDLHLICTHGVPVGDMLTLAPPLPLIVLYNCEVTTKDEDDVSIPLALSRHDRVRRIGLWMPASKLEKFIPAMDKEYPILELLSIECQTKDSDLMLPKKLFQSPHLCQISLSGIFLPMQSPFLPCTGGLVYLWLFEIPQSVHSSPHEMHIQLSSMPQLKILGIETEHSPDHNVVDSPIITPVTLPNLHVFVFEGGSTYLESLLAGISVPVLSTLCILFDRQLDFPVPYLLQFIQSSKSLIFKTFELSVSGDHVEFTFRPYLESVESPPVYYGEIEGGHLGQQVTSAVQILGTLSPVLSVVEKFTFGYITGNQPAGLHDIDRIQLRELLRPFSGVKTLHVQNELVKGVSQSLLSEDGELPLELLPNLEELRSSGSDVRDILTPFINERQSAGHPVTVHLE